VKGRKNARAPAVYDELHFEEASPQEISVRIEQLEREKSLKEMLSKAYKEATAEKLGPESVGEAVRKVPESAKAMVSPLARRLASLRERKEEGDSEEDLDELEEELLEKPDYAKHPEEIEELF